MIIILFIGLFSFYKSINLKAYNNQDVVLTGFSDENTEINMAFDDGLKNITGWAWSPDIGWISLNCLNDFDGDSTNGELDNKCDDGDDPVNYGVYWEDEKIKGCGWAPSISSWVCFSDPGGDYAGKIAGYQGVDINSTDYINSLDNEYGSGYASILGYEYLGDDEYKLAFPIEDQNNQYIASPSDPMSGCFNCWEKKQCAESLEDCSAVDNCGEDDICVFVDNVCNSCLNYVYCTEPSGCNAAGDPGGDYDQDDLITVYSSFGCSGCDSVNTGSCKGSSYAIDDQGSLISCNECNQNGYETPGVILDNNPLIYDENDNSQEMYDLCGFAWNGFDIDEDGNIDSGVGYLQFSPRISYEFNPYFSVERGSIYAEDAITGTEYIRPGAYNARFLIKSGGDITNMLSSMGNQVGIMEDIEQYGFLGLEAETGKYSNTLGTVDITGLSQSKIDTENKYGSDISNQITNNINDKVIVLDGDETVGINEFSGSGVIIVEGNLTITGDITYEDSSINKLSDIHSLVWIVEGDVNIEEDVELISGTFIILGDFNSCSNSSTCLKQLVVKGSVIADAFNLTRSFTAGAAEKFVNDGRLQVNPPAGLVDFSKALPRFSSDIY